MNAKNDGVRNEGIISRILFEGNYLMSTIPYS